MIVVATSVKSSPISNKGLFTDILIPKGMVVGILTHQAKLISEFGYQKGQFEGDNLIIMTGIRWVGDYFIVGDSITNEEYINHSDNPNLLYHCGILFSLREIESGEELTVDYKYFLAKKDHCRFKNIENGNLVDGLSALNSLEQSCKELLQLLSEIKDLA